MQKSRERDAAAIPLSSATVPSLHARTGKVQNRVFGSISMRLYRLSLLAFIFLGVALCQRTDGSDAPGLGYKLVPEWPIEARSAAGAPAGPWNLIQAPGVAIDASGHVLVLHRCAHPILEFDS